MPLDYRLYLLDPSGHIRQAVEFCCDEDETAITEAKTHAPNEAKELWQRARMVWRSGVRESA